MTFLNMDAMSVASNCSIIYYTPKGGYFFLFKLEGCALKVGGCKPPLGGLEIFPWPPSSINFTDAGEVFTGSAVIDTRKMIFK